MSGVVQHTVSSRCAQSGIFRIGVVHVLGSREAVCHVTVALAVARVQARAGVRMTPFGVLPARLIRLRGEGGCGFAECLCGDSRDPTLPLGGGRARSEEHTSELQSLMRISYAVFCLKNKKTTLMPISYPSSYCITISSLTYTIF